MKIDLAGFTRLLREALIILLFAYVLLLGGGFAALVSFRIQTLSTILALLIFGSWLVLRLVGKQGISSTNIDWAIWIFLAIQIIVVIFSEDPRRSLTTAMVWLVCIFVLYFAIDIFRNGLPQDLLFRLLLVVGAALILFALIDLSRFYLQWRQLIAGLDYFPSFQQRLSTLVGDPNLLAVLLNLLFPVALASLLLTKKLLPRIALGVYAFLSFVILYFTDSRGGLLGFGAALSVFLILWVLIVSKPVKELIVFWASWFWKRKIFLLILVLLVIVIVVLLAWRFLSFQGSTTHAPVIGARDIYWQAATNAFTADPITGAGPGMYPVYLMKIWSTPPARPYLHAHGLPFQVAAETGLLGLAGMAILIFMIVRNSRNSWQQLDPEARGRWVAAVAGVVGLSVHSLVDYFFPFIAVGVLVFIYFAIILNPKPEKQGTKHLSPWMLVFPGIAAAILSAYSLNAYSHADKAIELGNRGIWEEAAHEMEIAAESER